EGCEYRRRMIHALNSSERSWRVVFTSPEVSALQRAVEAGFGISAMTKWTVTRNMRILSAEEGFPQLEQLRVGLMYKHSRVAHSGLGLIESLIFALDRRNAIDKERPVLAPAD
ncbi:MAG: hypothetical protein K8F25_16140, partial [Fimbriimonadaceae bacterium]|nr:hypothetical protein [Alphaproteobacteria bacterium]